MQTQIVTIYTKETKFGIFFRWPIQKVYKDEIKSIKWLEKTKYNIISRLLNDYHELHKHMLHEDSAGLIVKQICSPIYFKKYLEKALHIFPENHTIQTIKVTIEKNESMKECKKEVMDIAFGQPMKKIINIINHEGRTKFFYNHQIKNIFNSY